MIHRRRFLRVAAAGAGAMLIAPRMVFANAATDRRFVFIIQRGAADGLDTIVPYAEPSYAKLRGALAIDPASALKLDGVFALHPSLVELGKLYSAKEALFVHAIASPYRERSHFDGQNVLETGGTGAYQVKDGWLNRLMSLLPQSHDKAIALAPTIPLALRGAAEATSYAPSSLPEIREDLLMRVGKLYAADDQLHPLWDSAMRARGLTEDAQTGRDPASVGRMAATFLGRADGPRIAMIETGGWDTHSAQTRRLGNQLKALDTIIAALRDGLGETWKQTVVLVATEFGRTAAANGTGGTDHGTASAAMLLGGAVKGGRILADWPGLDAKALHEGRDLRPTLDLNSLIAGATAENFGLDPERVIRTLFSGNALGAPVDGLIKA